MFTRHVILGLALLLALPAWAGLKIQHWTTAGGARVYFVENHELPLLDVSVTIPAGSARDTRERSGLAMMTHQVMNLGAGVWSEQEIAERLADVGAILSGHFDQDRAGFSLRTLSSDREREQALSLLRAVLTAPRFEAAILARERARAVAGLKEAATQPQYLGEKAFQAAVFGDHPYALDESGEIDALERLSREDLIAFHRLYYRAANATIAIMGDIGRAEAERLAEALTAGLPPGEASPPIPPVRAGGQGSEQVIPHPATQSHLFIGLPGMKRGDPDFFPLVVGNYILGGGGFDSRIMNEVRQKRGLAYSAYSTFQPWQELGPFMMGLQTRREATQEAVRVVRETLEQFLRDGPTEAELAQAKNYLIGSFPLRLDSNRKILDHLAVIGFYRLPLDWLDNYASQVEAVTREDILRAFRSRIRPEAMHTVIVGGQLEAANR
ncbi:MAG: M16 family metallopeptidase [Thiobacillaceae bacterium]